MNIKQLRKYITTHYARALNISLMGACELTDMVRWNEVSSVQLLMLLDQDMADNNPVNR